MEKDNQKYSLEVLKSVPNGPYCYKLDDVQTSEENKPPVFNLKSCPFWSINKNMPYQNNGYCSLLDLGDWMDDDRNIYTEEKTGKNMHIGLLWDQVKACGINE